MSKVCQVMAPGSICDFQIVTTLMKNEHKDICTYFGLVFSFSPCNPVLGVCLQLCHVVILFLSHHVTFHTPTHSFFIIDSVVQSSFCVHHLLSCLLFTLFSLFIQRIRVHMFSLFHSSLTFRNFLWQFTLFSLFTPYFTVHSFFTTYFGSFQFSLFSLFTPVFHSLLLLLFTHWVTTHSFFHNLFQCFILHSVFTIYSVI